MTEGLSRETQRLLQPFFHLVGDVSFAEKATLLGSVPKLMPKESEFTYPTLAQAQMDNGPHRPTIVSYVPVDIRTGDPDTRFNRETRGIFYLGCYKGTRIRNSIGKRLGWAWALGGWWELEIKVQRRGDGTHQALAVAGYSSSAAGVMRSLRGLALSDFVRPFLEQTRRWSDNTEEKMTKIEQSHLGLSELSQTLMMAEEKSALAT